MQQYRYEKILLPSFDTCCRLITDAYNRFEKSCLTIVDKALTNEQAILLDTLLPITSSDKPPYQRAQLVKLKQLNQSVRPSKIKSSIREFLLIKDYYYPLLSIIENLNLTSKAIHYYAGWFYKAAAAQVKQFPKLAKRYLHLIAFIIHQYHRYQDSFIDIILKTIQSMLNRIERKKEKATFLAHNERNKAAQVLLDDRNLIRSTLVEIKNTGLSPKLTAQQKVAKILNLVEKAEIPAADVSLITRFIEQLSENKKDSEHFDYLEKTSFALQNKLNGFFCHLDFDTTKTTNALSEALHYFQAQQGAIIKDSPTDFLSSQQKKQLYNSDGHWRTSLYKVLLFLHVADSLKAGTLALTTSYRYQYIDDYLYYKTCWETERDTLLEKYALNEFSDSKIVTNKLKQDLDQRYEEVNTSIKAGDNRYLQFDNNNEVIVRTPKVEKPNSIKISELLAPWRYISVLQILHDIERASRYTQYFTHYSIKHVKSDIHIQTILASIIAQGCNIGASKVANTSKGVDLVALNHAITWRFTLSNLLAANDCIVELIQKLPLAKLMKDNNNSHSSSDGQKKPVESESLNANPSYKYFGQGQGVSIYTFIDEQCALFYSTVISSSEREAAYVIDGLLHDDAIKGDIHSTDSHGFTEIVFALCYLLGISFAPRLARLKKQILYTVTPKHYQTKKDYAIFAGKNSNVDLIKSEWKTILRLVAAIKSKKTTASQLLKRLSSYNKDNPLYKALQKLGRIVKTLFILTYIDDVKFRQRIQKQLNRIELSNKFSDAVFFAKNQTFYQITKEDQEIAVHCKRLIQNAIILWNYLILSQQFLSAKTTSDKNQIIDIIRNGSVITWSHINVQGEYNFLTMMATNDPQFNLLQLTNLFVG